LLSSRQAFSESQVHDRLNAILEAMEKLGGGKTTDREMVRVNELIKVRISSLG